jgi:hypothetical protein
MHQGEEAKLMDRLTLRTAFKHVPSFLGALCMIPRSRIWNQYLDSTDWQFWIFHCPLSSCPQLFCNCILLSTSESPNKLAAKFSATQISFSNLHIPKKLPRHCQTSIQSERKFSQVSNNYNRPVNACRNRAQIPPTSQDGTGKSCYRKESLPHFVVIKSISHYSQYCFIADTPLSMHSIQWRSYGEATRAIFHHLQLLPSEPNHLTEKPIRCHHWLREGCWGVEGILLRLYANRWIARSYERKHIISQSSPKSRKERAFSVFNWCTIFSIHLQISFTSSEISYIPTTDQTDSGQPTINSWDNRVNLQGET